MAWTEPPRDWTSGELVTESIMDTHVRDQFKATWHLLARKTSDQSISSSTLTDDTALLFAVGASDVWAWEQTLLYDVSASVDMQVQWSFPASGTFNATGVIAGSGTGTPAFQNYFDSSSPTTAVAIDGFGAGTPAIALIRGVYVGGGTAGNVTFRWCNNAAGTAIVKANSTIWGNKLA